MPQETPTLTSVFTDIADAIRQKAGTQQTMTPEEMPQAITDIVAGGSPIRTVWDDLTKASDSPELPESLKFLSYFDTEIDEENSIVKILNLADSNAVYNYLDFPGALGFNVDVPRYVTIDGQQYSVMFRQNSLCNTYDSISNAGTIHIEYLQFYEGSTLRIGDVFGKSLYSQISLFIDDCVDGATLVFYNHRPGGAQAFATSMNVLSIPTHMKLTWGDDRTGRVNIQYLMFHAVRPNKPKFNWEEDIIHVSQYDTDYLDVGYLDVDHVSGLVSVLTSSSIRATSLLTCSSNTQDYSFSIQAEPPVASVRYFGQDFHLSESGESEEANAFAEALSDYLDVQSVYVTIIQPTTEGVIIGSGAYEGGSGSGSGSGPGDE